MRKSFMRCAGLCFVTFNMNSPPELAGRLGVQGIPASSLSRKAPLSPHTG